MAVALCAALVAACASSDSQSPAEKPAVRPIARIVTRGDTSREPRFYFRNWKSSRIEYDGTTYLNPVFPTTTVIEDCENVTGIGLVIGADPTSVARSRVLARFRWSHSSIETRKRKFDQFKLPWGDVYQDWIRLDEDLKVDGTWHVLVTYLGKEIFRTSFELRNCNHGRPLQADSSGSVKAN